MEAYLAGCPRMRLYCHRDSIANGRRGMVSPPYCCRTRNHQRLHGEYLFAGWLCSLGHMRVYFDIFMASQEIQRMGTCARRPAAAEHTQLASRLFLSRRKPSPILAL